MHVVRSRRVATPEGIRPAAIWIRDGKIVNVGAWAEVPDREIAAAHGEVVDLVDYGELAILPGIVDTHVHLNEPGRTEWEGFATATTAAAIGGVTTLIDMPLNSIPPTTTREAFAAKRAAAKGQCAVDVGFWGGVVPGNQGELAELVEDGVRGFKCFLVDSGVAEFGCVGETEPFGPATLHKNGWCKPGGITSQRFGVDAQPPSSANATLMNSKHLDPGDRFNVLPLLIDTYLSFELPCLWSDRQAQRSRK